MENEDQNVIAILPLGAHEQHGPHLPLQTDTIIATEFANRLQANIGFVELRILPTQAIGYSIEHLGFPGTKSLTYDQAITQWLEIIEKEQARGIKKFLLLNAHGGNSPLLTIIATEARIRWNILVAATNWTRFGLPNELAQEIDKSIDIHAGDIETSIMLAIAPERVDINKAKPFSSQQSNYRQQFEHLSAYGPHFFGWKMTDLNGEGAVGNAHLASAQKGEKLIAHALKGLTELIKDIDAFDVNKFK